MSYTETENVYRYVGQEVGTPLPSHVWPGVYALTYVTVDGDELCANCATVAINDPDELDPPIGAMAYGADADYPDDDVHCAECDALIIEGGD